MKNVKMRDIKVMAHGGVSWWHEFKDELRTPTASFVGDASSIKFSFQTDKPDRNWFVLDTGVVALLSRRLDAFANYSRVTAIDPYRSWSVLVGLRVPF